VVIIGFISWLILEVLFLTVGLSHASLPLILITYGLRRFGYPFFAFGFLVWITVVTPQARTASAMGWF
jgi:hypothetical protein